ncbi:uncharacterized protein LOC131188211 [Ahaetulla prasina]|uniref:uncharacterized protein LOC131188211 n=1 Tax=Ahaetulla prasina TaxID=499056 RepID=UPI002648059B|nr:uncharacterized protein LOC131188211 [Ahaetulla prasina]
MGGLLTCRQFFTRMESLKDHSFWDLCRTRVRHHFLLILVTVIMLILYIIHYSPELVRKCPKDHAKLLHNISQLEAEKLTLKEQLIKMEKKMQKLRNVMNQTQEKSLKLLEKKQEERDVLSKELSVCNQSLVLTRQQRDSWQKQLNTLEEKLKSPGSKTKEYEGKIAEHQQQIEQGHVNVRHERKEIQDLEDQLTKHKPVEHSKGGLLLGPSMVLLPLLLAALLF